MSKKTINVILLSLFLLLIDLLSKYIFYNQEVGKYLGFLEPVFNTGVSWGMQIPLLLVIVVSILAIGVFVWIYHKKYFSSIVFIFLFTGTLGNLVDRIWLGGVRDFLLVFHRFPVFNLADVFLNIGIIYYILTENFHFKRKRV